MAKSTQTKTQPTQESVEDFLSTLKDEQQRKDAEELIHLMSKITGKPAVMWGSSIIGFDRYHYKYASGREGDMAAVSFSPRKTNFAIYLVDGTSRYPELMSKLGAYDTGKACLYIKRLIDVDMNVLEKLIRSSYQYIMSHETDMHRAELIGK